MIAKQDNLKKQTQYTSSKRREERMTQHKEMLKRKRNLPTLQTWRIIDRAILYIQQPQTSPVAALTSLACSLGIIMDIVSCHIWRSKPILSARSRKVDMKSRMHHLSRLDRNTGTASGEAMVCFVQVLGGQSKRDDGSKPCAVSCIQRNIG